jgi:hypothetical protein
MQIKEVDKQYNQSVNSHIFWEKYSVKGNYEYICNVSEKGWEHSRCIIYKVLNSEL